MIMDEVVLDEVSLAGQGGFGSGGQPVRGLKRPVESAMNNVQAAKRQRKGIHSKCPIFSLKVSKQDCSSAL